VLAVSQFTLLADARKGRRPYYGAAAEPDRARPLYEYFMERIRGLGLPCEGGVFQASMRVRYTNDGPVTILLDSRKI
jgi:D-tyrosyl-tRNA(Tyr) deacylase